jgi:hypothetical protein
MSRGPKANQQAHMYFEAAADAYREEAMSKTAIPSIGGLLSSALAFAAATTAGAILVVLCLLPAAQAENLIEKSNDVRTILNFQVSDSAVSSLLPAGWQSNPSPSGVSKGANLTLLFTDRLLVQDGEGNSINGGTNRVIVLIVPAKEIATGINASVVVAGYSGSAEGIPGAYKLYLPGKIQMTRTTRSADKGLGENEELWSLGTATGDQIELAIKYERSIPSQVNAEQKVYSAAVPGFYRIYKVD